MQSTTRPLTLLFPVKSQTSSRFSSSLFLFFFSPFCPRQEVLNSKGISYSTVEGESAPITSLIQEAETLSPFFAGTHRSDFSNPDGMWMESKCSASPPAGARPFHFTETKDLDIGAKEFKVGMFTQMLGRGNIEQDKNFCSTFSSEAGSLIKILGKNLEVFTMRVDGVWTKEEKLAKATLMILGYQMATSTGDVQYDKQRAPFVQSALCDKV